ncbi:MAG: hypothetical protein P8101_08350, partial [Candidatus Thiodiazotropha sp.]
ETPKFYGVGIRPLSMVIYLLWPRCPGPQVCEQKQQQLLKNNYRQNFFVEAISRRLFAPDPPMQSDM